MKTSVKAMLLVLFSTIFTAAGQIFYKLASARLDTNLVHQLTNYPLFAGAIVYGIGAIMLLVALKHGELSVLYPIYALNFIWVSILSPVFFPSDSMNIIKWFGVLSVIVGVSLIGMGGISD